MHRFFVRIFAASEPPGTKSLPVTFEAALLALEQLPRMFAEPDGSFVWTSPPGADSHWQVDGNLVDGGERLYYAELKGSCPPDALDQLLACLSDGSTALAFEAVEQGVVLSEEELRRGLTLPPDAPAPAPDRPA